MGHGTFTWKDVIFFKNNDGSYKGAALRVYRGDPESYWTFITPEACKTLDTYREKWKSQTGKYPKDDDPLIMSVKFRNIRRLNAKGVRKRMDKIVGIPEFPWICSEDLYKRLEKEYPLRRD